MQRRPTYLTRRLMSATRTETLLRDVPQSVSVVSRALIADQAMQSMADVARYVPGVSMGLGEGHRDAPTIRGNSSTADFFVDGVRDDAQYLRDVYNVERVEVLKGSNAMTFGRGGGGGVFNRVLKAAQWTNTRSATIEVGSFGHERATVDVGQSISPGAAIRVNALVDESGTFRVANLQSRQAVNPTLSFLVAPRTMVRLGYEYLNDTRTVDRGIPSYQGKALLDRYTAFFGNPTVNTATMQVRSATSLLEHVTASGIQIRNRSSYSSYGKFYQNSFPGAVVASGATVALSAYNHRIDRKNLFNQTDVTLERYTGSLKHTLLAGAELGSQDTEQFRSTGYFNGTTTTVQVPLSAPTVSTPLLFRQSATDADNQTAVSVASAYMQDQIVLGSRWELLAGARIERFAVRFHNNRDTNRVNARLARTDLLVSPRVGLVFHPIRRASTYASVTRSWLPSTGDQFSSLTVTTRALVPERFTNQEIGAKIDLTDALSLTAAWYQLDRTNTTATDPLDAARVVQTGAQRTRGVEAGLSGDVTSRWQIAGGMAIQQARIVHATTAAKAGATVPLVPSSTASLWNRYRVARGFGVGVGVVHQNRMYAAIDNTLRIPAFTRVDAALFATLHRTLRAQVNVENAFDRRYIASTQGNNNLMPGALRTWRMSLTATP